MPLIVKQNVVRSPGRLHVRSPSFLHCRLRRRHLLAPAGGPDVRLLGRAADAAVAADDVVLLDDTAVGGARVDLVPRDVAVVPRPADALGRQALDDRRAEEVHVVDAVRVVRVHHARRRPGRVERGVQERGQLLRLRAALRALDRRGRELARRRLRRHRRGRRRRGGGHDGGRVAAGTGGAAATAGREDDDAQQARCENGVCRRTQDSSASLPECYASRKGGGTPSYPRLPPRGMVRAHVKRAGSATSLPSAASASCRQRRTRSISRPISPAPRRMRPCPGTRIAGVERLRCGRARRARTASRRARPTRGSAGSRSRPSRPCRRRPRRRSTPRGSPACGPGTSRTCALTPPRSIEHSRSTSTFGSAIRVPRNGISPSPSLRRAGIGDARGVLRDVRRQLGGRAPDRGVAPDVDSPRAEQVVAGDVVEVPLRVDRQDRVPRPGRLARSRGSSRRPAQLGPESTIRVRLSPHTKPAFTDQGGT